MAASVVTSQLSALLREGADAALVARIRAGDLPVHEPGLSAAGLRLTASAADLADCALVYIAPDVPTDDAGHSDLAPLDVLIAAVAPHVRAEATIVILSQVPPGFTRGQWRRDRRFLYQVETLVFGRAVERALHPELAKRIVRTNPQGRSQLGQMSALTLVLGTRAGGGRDTPPARQQKDVTILDIYQNAASAKIIASDWIDYLHLAKWNGRWVIVNVLWELKPSP